MNLIYLYLSAFMPSRGKLVIERLISEYDGAFVGLNHENVFQLAVSTILSAQTTDASVNRVTPEFFRRFPDADALANADIGEVKELIKNIGLYNSKAENIVKMSKMLIMKYDGNVPDSMEELMSLPGIGRKTANIIMSVGFGRTEGIAVDTHVFRISRRTGLSGGKTPLQVEKDLLREIPKKYWKYVNHILITHGRSVCTARAPKCSECIIKDLCDRIGVE